MQSNTIAKITLAGAVLFLAAGCHSSGTTDNSSAMMSPAPTDVMASPTPSAAMMSPTPTPSGAVVASPAPTGATAGAEKTFTVVGSNFAFSPSSITVNKGDKVKIIFQNSDGFHNWMLDEFNAKTDTIKAGESATVEFTADKTGTFQYYCGVGDHRAMGMVGNFIVK